MQTKHLLFGLLLSVTLLSSFKTRENAQKVKDYFSIPGPVEFNKTVFNLSWSSHPNANYYKQEYIPAGERSETFSKMIMVEALVGNMSPKEAMISKRNELEERKKTDAVTNYQVIENPSTGECLLDFVISSGDIIEWNAYRYTTLKNGSTKGLVLFAYSKRSYGSGSTGFLQSLKTQRVKDISTLASYKIPAIKLK